MGGLVIVSYNGLSGHLFCFGKLTPLEHLVDIPTSTLSNRLARACTQGSKDELRVKSEIVGYSAVCGWNSKKLKPCKTELLFCLCWGFKWGRSMSLGEQATFLCNIGVGHTSCLMWQGNRDSENCYTLISSWKQCTCFWCDLKRNLYPLFFLEAMCTGSKLEEAENSWCC